MRKGNKMLAAILAAAMTVTSVSPAFAASEKMYTGTVYETEGTTTPEQPGKPEYKPGWNKIDGKLYYCDENGALASGWKTIDKSRYYFEPETNAAATGLMTIGGKRYYFGKDAKLYVSKLYQKIGKQYYSINSKGILKKLSRVEVMAAQRVTKEKKNLKRAFLWSSRIRYKALKAPSPKKAAVYYGEYGFKNGLGDCYVQAYTFYWMAKALGYKVKVVRGYVPQAIVNGKPAKFGAHAWCEIRHGKKTYVYDPNFETMYRGKGYKFRYGDKGHYRYFDSHKKEIKNR